MVVEPMSQHLSTTPFWGFGQHELYIHHILHIHHIHQKRRDITGGRGQGAGGRGSLVGSMCRKADRGGTVLKIKDASYSLRCRAVASMAVGRRMLDTSSPGRYTIYHLSLIGFRSRDPANFSFRETWLMPRMISRLAVIDVMVEVMADIGVRARTFWVADR